ncbi:MAG: hypothetical protein GY707_07000, partial [Desulfobacteraceae bacterium]|nr:hypothetical protein [Desulfobacteraceae bacterium]
MDAAPRKPKVISSDNGNEFLGPVSELLRREDVVQRFKAVNDTNALGVVDRAIQTLKQRLAEMAARTQRTWPALLTQALDGVNRTPKSGVLHGEAPKDVRDNDKVRFMMLQDNAKKLQHNAALTQKRQANLRETNAFRAPLDNATSKFKRGFRATYGDVQRVAHVRGSTVTARDGKTYDLQKLKVVPADTNNANA